MQTKPTLQYFVLILGCSFSIIMVGLNPGLYAFQDVKDFLDWGNYWNNSWSEIYINCAKCNYPIIGTFFSAGILSIFKNIGVEDEVFLFRCFLGIIDGINVLLVYWLLKKFSVKNAPLWAGIIGILPSSWAGAALWGQIDSISQLILLVTIAWVVQNHSREPLTKTSFIRYLFFSGVFISTMLMVKQIGLFNVFPFVVLLLVDTYLFNRTWRDFYRYFPVIFISSGFMVFFWDLFLKLKDPYFSHVIYILRNGSRHGFSISGNGFNIWMFLGREMWSDSRVPFFSTDFSLSNLSWLFSPFVFGLSLFFAYILLITGSLLLYYKSVLGNKEKIYSQQSISHFLFYFCLVTLGYNIFLTGTHERYLFHFYPLIILVILSFEQFNKYIPKSMLILSIIGSVLYGLFVLGVLNETVEKLGYYPHWVLGLFHISFFVLLTIKYFQLQSFRKNLLSLNIRTQK